MANVLITGGSRGIGAACVRAFCQKGDRVVFLYRSNHEKAEALEKETSDPAIIYDDAESTDEPVHSEDISVSRIEKQKRRPFAPFGFKFDLGHIFSHGFGFEELLLIALILLVAQSDTQDDLLIFLAVLIFIG